MLLNPTNWAFNVSSDYRTTIRAVKSLNLIISAVGMVIKQIGANKWNKTESWVTNFIPQQLWVHNKNPQRSTAAVPLITQGLSDVVL